MMFRSIFMAVGVASILFSALELASQALSADQRAAAEMLMGTFLTSTNLDKKLESLRGLEKIRGTVVDDFLLKEYGKLDGTNPRDARLLGGILRVWAAHPDKSVLPFLIYEGLFHEDIEVVRVCATAIGKASEDAKAVMSTGTAKGGGDPGEELAADLIHRMGERADLLPSIEKVLWVWSGKTRPGFKPDGELNRKPGDKERQAAHDFWQGWFAERFKRKPKGASH